MNLQFSGNVSSMGDDGVDRDAQLVGDFFILQALHNSNDDILFAFGDWFALLGVGVTNHGGDVLRNVILFVLVFHTADGWRKYKVFDIGVMTEPFFVVVDVVQRRRK